MRPHTTPTGSVTDLRERRAAVLYDLSDGRRHLLSLLAHPDPTTEAIPVGDLLCRAPGLCIDDVSRICFLAKVSWGRRVGLLSKQEVEAICFWIKDRHPDTWEGWRETVRTRARIAGTAPAVQMRLGAAA